MLKYYFIFSLIIKLIAYFLVWKNFLNLNSFQIFLLNKFQFLLWKIFQGWKKSPISTDCAKNVLICIMLNCIQCLICKGWNMKSWGNLYRHEVCQQTYELLHSRQHPLTANQRRQTATPLIESSRYIRRIHKHGLQVLKGRLPSKMGGGDICCPERREAYYSIHIPEMKLGILCLGEKYSFAFLVG